LELNDIEKLAFAFLQSQPNEIQKVAVNGNIQLIDLYNYFNRFALRMELSKRKRDNEIVDADYKRGVEDAQSATV
jgi:sulfur relay (sulfurtransferase) DsrF/TusC family protein